ncbi:MAG: PqqD family protein, partial [Bacteroidaceae bacterium]|nr:PqqD family protein [Bacteroidaceae bacterium]
LNESAAFLWNAVGKEEFTVEQMADILCAEYEVTPETALNDVREMLAQWQEQDLVE